MTPRCSNSTWRNTSTCMQPFFHLCSASRQIFLDCPHRTEPKSERGSRSQFALHPYASAVLLDYRLHSCEADTCARHLPPVEPLKYSPDAVLILRLYADPVIFHADGPGFLVIQVRPDAHSRLFVRFRILDRVRQQVLHNGD